MKGGTGYIVTREAQAELKVTTFFSDNQLRKLRQCGKSKVKTFRFLEINATMRSIFKFSQKFLVCSDFIGAMSDQHMLVFKMTD